MKYRVKSQVTIILMEVFTNRLLLVFCTAQQVFPKIEA